MARMGHSSVRAALIYQHASRSRDKQIADGISHNVRAARSMGHADGHDGLTQMTQALGHLADLVRSVDSVVETKGLEPSTPAVQRRCSAS
jgi:hypothetical protein